MDDNGDNLQNVLLSGVEAIFVESVVSCALRHFEQACQKIGDDIGLNKACVKK